MATSSRLDFRVDSKSKRIIEQAASALGQSISDFAKSTLLSKARNVLRQHHETVLSDRDRDIFLAMLDSNAKPNAALKKAAKAYAQSYREPI